MSRTRKEIRSRFWPLLREAVYKGRSWITRGNWSLEVGEATVVLYYGDRVVYWLPVDTAITILAGGGM